jgi:hypothetical protein
VPLPAAFANWDPRYEDLVCPVFTADQMRAYGNARARAATERAAQVCRDKERSRSEVAMSHPEGSPARERCSAAARSALDCAYSILADAGIKEEKE